MPKLSSAKLCHEDSNITHENWNFKICLLCLLSFHHTSWNNYLGEIQHTAKKKRTLHPKGIIGIMAATKNIGPCWELFKKFNILPLASEFQPSLLSFIVVNMEKI
jgi:hypothetical protein